MREKRSLLVDEKVNEAAEQSRRIVDTTVGGLAEEKRHELRCAFIFKPRRGAHLVNDGAEKHCLAFSGIAVDPQHSTLLVVTQSLIIDMFEDLPV